MYGPQQDDDKKKALQLQGPKPLNRSMGRAIPRLAAGLHR